MTVRQDLRWWREEHESERARRVFEAFRRVRQRNSERRRSLVQCACLYGDGGLDGLSQLVTRFAPGSLQFNVVRRTVDTCAAKIAKARPLPMALTSGGDFRQRRRAQRLSRFFAGAFDECDVFETSELVARDALIFGTGISRCYVQHDKPVHERVLVWEIDVDRLDARYGRPRTVYLHRWVDRAVLAEQFPEHRDAVLEASSDGFEDDPMLDRESLRDDDFVLVVEAWRLPSGPKAGDGRHVIAVNADGGALLDEGYEAETIPFQVLHYSRPLMGFWGDGFGHILRGIQAELNQVARKVQDSEYMMGSYVFVEDGSGIETDHIDNGVGTIVRYRGTPPTFAAPAGNAQQTIEYLSALRGSWAYEETGTSALSARSEKPAGLNSGAALRTFNDVESERFVLFGKAYERYHVDIAWALYECAESIRGYRVRATQKRVLDVVDFRDVRLDRDAFTLRVFPTSALSQDPAARRAEVGEYVQAGLIPPEVARGLLELPDLEDYSATTDAPRRIIEDIVWRILDAEDPSAPEVYVYPEPTFDLALCVQLGSQHYLRAKLDLAPQENLDLLMRFVTDAQAELQRSAPPPPPEAPPPPPDAPPPPPVPA